VAIRHNSKLAATEPSWGSVDKTKLPRLAYADMGEPDRKTSWRFPHHWVRNGANTNDAGVYTTGDMYLHRGGLNAAWAAAQGARSGRKAPQSVINHLQQHRRALGLGKSDEMTTPTFAELQTDPSKRSLHKSATYHRHLAAEKAFVDAKAEAPETKSGTISGYASVWDVVDHRGDVVRRGAFAKTIAERGSKIPLMVKHFCHGGDVTDAVGAIVKLEEDEYGLKFKAEWLADDTSQAVREKVLDLRSKGVKVGTSIGYRVISWGYTKDETSGRTYTELKELALGEITVTLKPMLNLTVVTDAKSDDGQKNLLAIFDPIEEAKTDEMTDEQKQQLIADVYGDADKAESLGKALKGIADKTLGLLASKPQDTEPTDGDQTSAGTPPTDTGADADEGSSTDGKAGQRSLDEEMEQMRMDAMRISAESV
jgi:hypothetical protein